MEFEFDSTWEYYQLRENLIHTLKNSNHTRTWIRHVSYTERHSYLRRTTSHSSSNNKNVLRAGQSHLVSGSCFQEAIENYTTEQQQIPHRIVSRIRTACIVLKYKVARQQQQVGYIEWKTPPTTLSAAAVIHHKFSDDIGLGTFTTLHKGLWRSYPSLSLSGYLFSL